jgi:hypothetical protein
VKRTLAALSAAALPAGALAQPLGTGFTYQGRLTENNGAPTGTYDFQFRLFDAATGGNQLGPTGTVDDLQVTQGLFTTSLDFGAQFGGQRRWLQLEVRPGASTGAYTVLSPRQELMATPNAVFSMFPWRTNAAGIAYLDGGNVGIGTATPVGRLDVASGSNSYVRVGATWGDLHFNGGSDGVFGLINEGPPAGRTEIIGQGVARMAILNSGKIGVGTVDPGARFQVEAGVGEWGVFGRSPNSLGVFGQVNDTSGNNTGTGVLGRSESANQASNAVFGYASSVATGVYGVSEQGNGVRGATNGPFSSGVVGSANQPGAYGGFFYNTGGGVALRADGLCQVKVLQILGGGDVAEPFDVGADGGTPQPGHVVVIDAARPGRLRLCDTEYDAKVAGVISGANGLQPGMVLKATDRADANGERPVAMTGRAWCWVDASFGAVRPGDRLTTSPTTGHAMRVTDAARADGAVIGKAMTGLDEGRGLVLVLVNLQ